MEHTCITKYIGDSTKSEIEFARSNGKMVLPASPLFSATWFKRTCPYNGCSNPTQQGPCPLCYE